MLFDEFASKRILRPYRSIVRPLRTRVAPFGKAQWKIGLRIYDCVFLLKTKPEIIIVILDGSTAVGFVGGAVGIENFRHDKPAIAAQSTGIGVGSHGLE